MKKMKMTQQSAWSLAIFVTATLLSVLSVGITFAAADFTDVPITPSATYECRSCTHAVADDDGSVYALSLIANGAAHLLYIYPVGSTTGRTIEFPADGTGNYFVPTGTLAVNGGHIYIPGYIGRDIVNARLYVFPVEASHLQEGTLFDLQNEWSGQGALGNDMKLIVVNDQHVYFAAPNAVPPSLMIFTNPTNPLTAPPSFLAKVNLDPAQFQNYNPAKGNLYFLTSMEFTNDGTDRIVFNYYPADAALFLTIQSLHSPMRYEVDFSGVLINYSVAPLLTVNGATNDGKGILYVAPISGDGSIYSMTSTGKPLDRYIISGALSTWSVFLKQTTSSGNFLNMYVADLSNSTVYRFDSLAPAFGGSGIGDPQFHGLRGQSFHVHGVNGNVYSIFSDELLQVNARFDYLDHGECPPHLRHHQLADEANRKKDGDRNNCWSRPGYYFGLLTLQTNNGDRLRIVAGSDMRGFDSVIFNGKVLDLDNNEDIAINSTLSIVGMEGPDQMSILVQDKYHMIVKAGIFTFKIENSDKFVNILSVVVHDRRRLVDELRSHGILGQTWRVLQGNQRGIQVPEIEGIVEDYANSNGDEWGHDSSFNKFMVTA